MYTFIDTTQQQAQIGSILPTEAMSYDGIYIENEINGYRTLYVSGRELMASEVSDETINLIDGSKYYGKRYPARTIVVGYQLIADNAFDFRSKFNKLNNLLSGENVKIIFNDEIDKYFIGTKVGNSTPEPGTNTVTGEIEIYCADPFKYSTVLKEMKASVNMDGILECTVNNEGSVPATVDYDIVMRSESGYMGIVSDSGAMQYGLVEELDGEDYQENELLLTLNDFFDARDDGASGKDYLKPNYNATGSLTQKTWFNKKFLSFGNTTSTNGSIANGGVRTLEIPVDSNGEKGCKNFYAYFHLIFYAGLMGQTGEMNINFLTADNKVIAGVNWWKTDSVGNTGHYELIANGKTLKQYGYTTSHLKSENPWYWDWGHCDLRKEGDKLTFFYYGNYPSFIIPEIENMECTKIQIACYQWGTRNGDQLLNMFGFDVFNFWKQNVDKFNDVPNRYPAGATLQVDGEEAKFYVNGQYKAQDEIVGTKYFKVPPGESKIQFYTSNWTKQNPDVTVKMREAWL